MSTHRISIGILDIQGSVEEHAKALSRLGVQALFIKTKEDLEGAAGLIIPGGESTTIGKLMKVGGLDKEIIRRAKSMSLCVWGTCAGAILIAKKILGGKPDSIPLMDIAIERNAYGGQQDSFETTIAAPALGMKNIPAIFIRAPVIKKTPLGEAKILAKLNGSPVMLRQGNLLATTFHPELTSDPRIHEYFISMVKEYAKKR